MRPEMDASDLMNQRDQKTAWEGFGDGLTQAVEMAVTPVVLALLGLWIDGRVGTRPAFTLLLLVFGIVGVFVKAYYHYEARAAALDEGKPWQRH